MTTHMSPVLLGEELVKFFSVTGDRLKIEPEAVGQAEGCGGTSGLKTQPATCCVCLAGESHLA